MRAGETRGWMQDAGQESPVSKAVVRRLLMAIDIRCWRGSSSPTRGQPDAASTLARCLAHVSGWSPKTGFGAFPSSVVTAGIRSAGSGNVLCSQDLGKSSLAVVEAEKAKVTAAGQGLFSLSASPCCENKNSLGPGEQSACVWASRKEFWCLWEDWLTECPRNV